MRLACVLAIAAAPDLASASISSLYSSFFVFGDSLSDNGNLYAADGGTQPASPPYYNGQFSNGPVWDTALMSSFTTAGEPTANFAFGGATATAISDAESPAIPSLATQVGGFLSSGLTAVEGPHPLASIWIGANDIFAALENKLPGITPDQIAAAAASSVVSAINTLSSNGIRDFLVFNLPDLGKTPAFAGSQAASQASNLFNTLLASDLAGLTGVNARGVDIESVFAAMLKNPGKYGLANTTDACIAVSGCLNGTTAVQDSYLFFDTVHPTEGVQQLIAQTALVAAVPAPLPASSLALGLGLLGLMSRRKRAA